MKSSRIQIVGMKPLALKLSQTPLPPNYLRSLPLIIAGASQLKYPGKLYITDHNSCFKSEVEETTLILPHSDVTATEKLPTGRVANGTLDGTVTPDLYPSITQWVKSGSQIQYLLRSFELVPLV